jgi:hypothetical protein
VAVPKEDMIYDGDDVEWYGVGKYNATSGLEGHQTASEQTKSDTGPIPEGTYSFSLKIAGTARVVNVAKNQLDANQGIQSLDAMPGPDGKFYEAPNWGKNRVRLNALYIANPKARGRGGFYLHDSTKGFTHGCVEVEPRFFTRLREYAKDEGGNKRGRRWLIIKVKYPSSTASTYGGTKVT